MQTFDTFWIKTIFLFLNFFTMGIMWIYGKKIARTADIKQCWKYAYYIIAAYSISMGLRFGRDIDYNQLFFSYEGIGNAFESVDYEFIFKCICWILYNIGIPFSGFIWLCSIAIMYAFLHLCINHYRIYTPLACLIFLFEAHDVELLIRYYLAFSFLLLAISMYMSASYKKSVIFTIIACNIHIGMIPIVVLYILFIRINCIWAPPYVIFGLLLFSWLVGSVEMLNVLTPFVRYFGFNEKALNYALQYENIINGDFSAVGSLEKQFSIVTMAVTTLRNALPIFLAPQLIKDKWLKTWECNLFFVGIILYPVFVQVQILNRLVALLTFFSVFVTSASIYYIVKNRKRFSSLMYYYALLVAFFVIWPSISMLVSREGWWHMLYIWNAGNWDTIPLQYFYQDIK